MRLFQRPQRLVGFAERGMHERQAVVLDVPPLGEVARLIKSPARLLGAAGNRMGMRGRVFDRVTCEAIDFFATVPAGGGVYLLSHILHDWTEDQCLAILRNCRRVMGPASRLLIVEMVLPAGDAPHPGKLLDLAMLVMPGGQERTEAEYAALVRRAGFELRRVVPTRSAVSIVEAVPTDL